MTDPAARRRVRVPPPVIPRRLASGRGATEQPNAAGDGDAPLDPAFWLAVVLTGVLAGLFGALMMFLLRQAQHVAFGYDLGSLIYLGNENFQNAAEHASGARRIVSLAIAGVLGGGAWYLVRRYVPGRTDIEDQVWSGTGDISLRRSLGTAVISEFAVGFGASLGREAAPRLLGAAWGSFLGRWHRFNPTQRRLLVACGAGAGLAAVYNVPLGGTLFIAEVLWGSITLPVLLPALVSCAVATMTAWIYIPAEPIYLGVPAYGLSGTEIVWAVLAGPLIGCVSVAYVRLVGWVSANRPQGLTAAGAPLVAFLALGVVALWFPQLLGNGKGIAHQAFLGQIGLWLLLALFVLKPIVTAMCLGSGASGGLFTPTLSIGAALGGLLGDAWNYVWPGTPGGAYAMVGAAAMIGAAMQAPLTGIVLVLELTQSGLALAAPMLIATLLATLVARYLDGYSIYSARLATRREGDAEPPSV